jgi:hypothetical protein
MDKPGKVVNIKEVATKGWMLGGVLQKTITASVKHDTGEIVDYPLQDLLKTE